MSWRDVPARYGPWKTLYKRFTRWQEDGTWARIEAMVQADADVAKDLGWHGHADSTIVRAHQHAGPNRTIHLRADDAHVFRVMG